MRLGYAGCARARALHVGGADRPTDSGQIASVLVSLVMICERRQPVALQAGRLASGAPAANPQLGRRSLTWWAGRPADGRPSSRHQWAPGVIYVTMESGEYWKNN